MVGPVVAATGSPIGRTDMDQHVFDVLGIRILQERDRVTSQRQDRVRFIPRRKPARELKTRVEEDAEPLFELWLGRAPHYYQSHGRVSGRDSGVTAFP